METVGLLSSVVGLSCLAGECVESIKRTRSWLSSQLECTEEICHLTVLDHRLQRLRRALELLDSIGSNVETAEQCLILIRDRLIQSAKISKKYNTAQRNSLDFSDHQRVSLVQDMSNEVSVRKQKLTLLRRTQWLAYDQGALDKYILLVNELLDGLEEAYPMLRYQISRLAINDAREVWRAAALQDERIMSLVMFAAQRTDRMLHQGLVIAAGDYRGVKTRVDSLKVVFSLLVINKAGGLIYNRTFAPGLQKLDSNDYLILAGTFHGIHAISRSINPAPEQQRNPGDRRPLTTGIESLESSHFRLTCFQTLTGVKFLLFTSPEQPNADAIVRRCYELYSDFVMKNAFYSLEMPIRVEKFDKALSGYLVRP